MKATPLVSVIIPTYKRPDLLKRAINSVKKQTYSNIEILVIDDGNDPEIFQSLEDDSKVGLLINEKNRGANYSRNRGLYEAKGELINFLDDDDEILPEKIEKQVKYWHEVGFHKYGMITCHTDDRRSEKSEIRYNKYSGRVYKDLLKKSIVHGTETVLYKRDELLKINGFDESLVANHEYDLLIRYSEHNLINFVDEILTRRFASTNQISFNFNKKMEGAKQMYSKHKKRMNNFGFLFVSRMWVKYKLIYLKFWIGNRMGENFYKKYLRS